MYSVKLFCFIFNCQIKISDFYSTLQQFCPPIPMSEGHMKRMVVHTSFIKYPWMWLKSKLIQKLRFCLNLRSKIEKIDVPACFQTIQDAGKFWYLNFLLTLFLFVNVSIFSSVLLRYASWRSAWSGHDNKVSPTLPYVPVKDIGTFKKTPLSFFSAGMSLRHVGIKI